MSKRFRDTGIWDKEWYRKLTPTQKCAWGYLTDRCDNVGVLSLDKELAEFYIGEKVDWPGLVESCNGNIVELGKGKWWLKDFCDFQYGELRQECKPHASYLSLLKRHGLEGYPKGILTLKEKDKDKDKDKEKDKEGEGFATFWASYPRRVNKAGALRAWKAREKDKTLDAGEVMAAVVEYTKQMAGRELQFVMHPATFLGPAMRWKDYLTTDSKYVPAAAASGDISWTCGGCGARYRSTAASCRACGMERSVV